MIEYPQIDPVAIAIGPLQVHWYGLMYVVGFVAAWWLGRRWAHRLGLSHDDIGDLLFYAAIGVVAGGRLGYVLFYDMEQFLANPLWAFRLWGGGMSFHGGLNHELPGRVSDLPWAMPFPHLGPELRHPSALYEFALEGVVLFVVLWWISSRPRRRGLVSGLFLLLYGIFRFAVEFVRLPDAHSGFIAFGWVTMSMLLTLPMVAAGAALILWSRRQARNVPTAAAFVQGMG